MTRSPRAGTLEVHGNQAVHTAGDRVATFSHQESTAQPRSLGHSMYAGPPAASARITRVGDTQLGTPIDIGLTVIHIFDTCPTTWKGALDGDGQVEVTLRTRYATGQARIHLTAPEPSAASTVQDSAVDHGRVRAETQLNPLIHGNQ